MFLLLKLLKPFLLPPTLIALGMIVALVAIRKRRRRWATVVLSIAFGVYYLLSIEPVAYALAWTLENSYRDVPVLEGLTEPPEGTEAIVILAGGASEKAEYRPIAELSGDSWRRLWQGIALFTAFGGTVPIIYSGGSGDPFQRISSEAVLAQSYAVTAGVPEALFWVEDRSRDTYENGVAVQALLDERFPAVREHRVILITSARHLPRSVAVFAGLGMRTRAIPASIETGSLDLDPLSFFPSATAFASSVASIHEWIGAMSYWIRGRV